MKLTSTVVLITYNGEKFFARQLETLASQSRLPDELIICDDCSTDRTVQIAEDFAKTAPFPVRIFRNEENLGPGLNFRQAFARSKADITFFCDQDDVWLPHKIGEAMEIYESEPAVGMVLQTDTRVNAREIPIPGRKFSPSLAKALQQANNFQTLLENKQFLWAAHNMSCRTEYFHRLFQSPPSTAFILDQWIFRCMGVLAEVRVLTESSLLFRRHGGNVTSHSKKTKSPLKLILRAIRYHVQINRIVERKEAFQQAVEYLENQPELMHPEFLSVYRQGAEHFSNRILANQQPRQRPGLILRELRKGNYRRFSKGISDALCDLLTPPEKIQENYHNFWHKAAAQTKWKDQ